MLLFLSAANCAPERMALGVHSESPDINQIPAQDTAGILDVIST